MTPKQALDALERLSTKDDWDWDDVVLELQAMGTLIPKPLMQGILSGKTIAEVKECHSLSKVD